MWSIHNKTKPAKIYSYSPIIHLLQKIDAVINCFMSIFYYIFNTLFNTNYSKTNILGADLYELADKGILRFLLDKADKVNNNTQPIIDFRIGHLNMVLITDIYLTRDLLKNNDTKTMRRGEVYDKLALFFGKGIFTGKNDPLWLHQRKLFFKLVTHKKLESYTESLYNTLYKAIENEVNDNDEIELVTFLSRIGLIAFCDVYLGIDITKESNDLIIPLNNVLKYINSAMVPFDVYFYTDVNYEQFKKDVDYVYKFMEKVINTMKDNNIGDPIILNEFTNGTMTLIEQIQFMISIILGGHETTSRLLLGISCAMFNDNKISNNLKNELYNYFLENETINYNIIHNHYLKNIIREGTRLFSPVWLCSREALTDINLNNTIIKKGTQIMICPLIIHRDKNIWGPTHEEFDPDRFNNRTNYINNYFFPFLIGPENCTGETFANLEASLILIILFKHYDIQILDNNINPQSLGTFRITDKYMISIKKSMNVT